MPVVEGQTLFYVISMRVNFLEKNGISSEWSPNNVNCLDKFVTIKHFEAGFDPRSAVRAFQNQ